MDEFLVFSSVSVTGYKKSQKRREIQITALPKVDFYDNG
jgi:hypothetical protein